MPTRGLPELGRRDGLFDYELLAEAFERRGGGEGGGDAATLCTPLTLFDMPSALTDRGFASSSRTATAKRTSSTATERTNSRWVMSSAFAHSLPLCPNAAPPC